MYTGTPPVVTEMLFPDRVVVDAMCDIQIPK